MKVTQLIFAIVLTVAVLLGCSEDSRPRYPLICQRGDDGREFVYEYEGSTDVNNIFTCSPSPDASKICLRVLVENTPDWISDIAVLDLSTMECQVIMHDEVGGKWSTSGEWIAYSSLEGPSLSDLWFIRPDGSGKMMSEMQNPYWEIGPADWFNKDHNKLLIFVTIHSPESERGEYYYIYEMDSGDYYEITAEREDMKYWGGSAMGPEDEWFAKSQMAPAWEYDPSMVYMPLTYLRTDGSNERIVEIREPRANLFASIVDWSPDGNYLLFWARASDENLTFTDTELWTYKIATGEFKQLTMAPEGYVSPIGNMHSEVVSAGKWATDGYIYFVAEGKLYRIKGPA